MSILIQQRRVDIHLVLIQEKHLKEHDIWVLLTTPRGNSMDRAIIKHMALYIEVCIT